MIVVEEREVGGWKFSDIMSCVSVPLCCYAVSQQPPSHCVQTQECSDEQYHSIAELIYQAWMNK